MTAPTDPTTLRASYKLGPMPLRRSMMTVDKGETSADPDVVFRLVADVERWPAHLAHYRWVTMHERTRDGGGIVEMAAYRPFGPLNWPTWWKSHMTVDAAARLVRFRHIGGITTGMDVEWAVTRTGDRTHVVLLHVWDGPAWPLIGTVAAVGVIGPIFVHGIASRTMAGLLAAAERGDA
jgi:ribosome-associated toxin RatA of RatAB toxin-antitoxin module